MFRKCTTSCRCRQARALLWSRRLGLWACCIYFFALVFENLGCGGHWSGGRALCADATGRVWSKLFAPGEGGGDRCCVLKIYCLNPTSSHAIMVHVHTQTSNEPTHSKQVRTCSWSIPQPNAIQKISPLFLQLDGPLLLIMYVALLNLHEKR
jgi:hypothetical protein